MIDNVLVILALLFIKHYLVDFVLQTQEEIDNKGKFFKWKGFKHSLKHGLLTAFVLYLTPLPAVIISFLAIFDMVVHYLIDWIKMNYGNKDIKTKQFWNHLGLDQLAHQLTYIFIIGSIT